MNRYVKWVNICISIIITQNAYAGDLCNAILQYGIFDKDQVLDVRSNHRMAKSTYCSSSNSKDEFSASLDIDGYFTGSGRDAKTEINKVCSSNENEVANDAFLHRLTNHASSVLASAWVECIKLNQAGTSHYISPSVDKNRFNYKITFTPSGANSTTKVQSWNVVPNTVDCVPAKLKRSDKIDAGGTSITCTRQSENDTVTVVANVTEGGNHLKQIEFRPFEDRTDPPPPQITPTGVINMKGVFDGDCSNPYREYGWNGHSRIKYCKQIGTASRYYSDVKIMHGSNINLRCVERMGQGWTDVAWNGRDKITVCAKVNRLDVLRLGNVDYLEDIKMVFNQACPLHYSELVSHRGLRWCGKLEQITVR